MLCWVPKLKIKVLQPAFKVNYSSVGISLKNPRIDQLKADFKKSFKKLVDAGLYDDLYSVHGIKINRQVEH